MVLIFSNQNEPTTDLVLDWLIKWKIPFQRINSEDISTTSNEVSFDPCGKVLTLNGKEISEQEVSVCWYRRWNHFGNLNFKSFDFKEQQLKMEVFREASILGNSVFSFFRKAQWLTDPTYVERENKLVSLRKAVKNGLPVPETRVLNTREEVISFYEAHNGRVIFKTAGDTGGFQTQEGDYYRCFAEKLEEDMLATLPETFFPTVFQQKIDKKFEIRVFYLDGVCYSTAMLQENQENTDIKLDNGIHQNNKVKMLRTQLPPSVEKRLRDLMKDLGLNCGSIDLLVDTNNIHHFLEVNPVGQFLGYGWEPNYQLEKKVAEWIRKKHYDHEKIKAILP